MEEKDWEEIFLRGDQRYRKIEDCDETVESQEKEQGSMKKDITALKVDMTAIVTRLNWLIGIVAGVGGLFAAYLAKLVFGG